jgi:parvulin-like peptidyl-prolyl isomerase
MVNLSKALIDPDQIVEYLKKDIQLKPMHQKILYRKIIDQAVQERGISVTPEEIQEEADRIRRENRLEKAADTLNWLETQMITADDWEEGIVARLKEEKLAAHLFDKEVEKFFAQNKLDYDRVLLYQLVVSSEKLAHELFYQIEEQEISFYQAAHLYDIDPGRRYRCGCEGKIERQKLMPAIAAAVFGHPVGEVIRPIQIEQTYHLLLVEDLIPAELTPKKKQTIRNRMFREWLESELTYMLHNQEN